MGNKYSWDLSTMKYRISEVKLSFQLHIQKSSGYDSDRHILAEYELCWTLTIHSNRIITSMSKKVFISRSC